MSETANENSIARLDHHREKLLSILLRVFVLFAAPPMIMGFIDTPQAMVIPAILYAPCVISALMPQLNYRFRAVSLIGFIYFSAINALLNFGVFSPGRLFGILIVLLVSVLLGMRAGLLSILGMLLTFAGVAFVVVEGHVQVDPEAIDVSSVTLNWVWYSVTFFTVAITVYFAVTYLIRSLTEQLERLAGEVAEKEEAREAERKASEQYRLLAENARDVIWTMDLKGNMTYVSPSIERMRGVTPEQVLNNNIPESMAAHRQPEMVELMWEEMALEDEGTADPNRYRTIETKLVRADGSTFDAEMICSFLRDDSGNAIGVLGVTRDITERRALEHQLQHSQKMESMGQLAGGVAHDFNNLLQAILGYADLARHKAGENSDIADDVGEIINAGDRAKALVRQLLAFSRRQVLTLHEARLSGLITGVQKLLRRVIGEGVEIEYTPNHTEDQVRIDAGQMEQVLMNLCVNSRDAMPNGGRITITTENAKLDSAFCASNTWARPGRFIRMSVADTGTGIEESTLAHIFEPFFTSKDQGKGTGLGLSTVFGIVRQHNGLIDVESKVGEGTTFHVYLPLLETEADTPKDTAAEAPTGGTEAILLADDDEMVRRVVKIMLTREGYTVHAEPDGQAAMAYYDQHADEIDMLLLDIIMPNAGGRKVAEHAMKHNPDLPVLFLTGYDKPDDGAQNGPATGITDILEKPFHHNDLLIRVRQCLDRAKKARDHA